MSMLCSQLVYIAPKWPTQLLIAGLTKIQLLFAKNPLMNSSILVPEMTDV